MDLEGAAIKTGGRQTNQAKGAGIAIRDDDKSLREIASVEASQRNRRREQQVELVKMASGRPSASIAFASLPLRVICVEVRRVGSRAEPN